MQKFPVAPELRSPQLLLRKLRRKAACLRVTVALALVFSICALVYAIAHVPASASWSGGGLV